MRRKKDHDTIRNEGTTKSYGSLQSLLRVRQPQTTTIDEAARRHNKRRAERHQYPPADLVQRADRRLDIIQPLVQMTVFDKSHFPLAFDAVGQR